MQLSAYSARCWWNVTRRVGSVILHLVVGALRSTQVILKVPCDCIVCCVIGAARPLYNHPSPHYVWCEFLSVLTGSRNVTTCRTLQLKKFCEFREILSHLTFLNTLDDFCRGILQENNFPSRYDRSNVQDFVEFSDSKLTVSPANCRRPCL